MREGKDVHEIMTGIGCKGVVSGCGRCAGYRGGLGRGGRSVEVRTASRSFGLYSAGV